MIGREIIFKGPLIILSFGLERNSRIFIMRMFLANTIFRDPRNLLGFHFWNPAVSLWPAEVLPLKRRAIDEK